MIMYERLHTSFVEAMQQHLEVSILVQQSLIQMIILVLDSDVSPMLDCMLQPRYADPGEVALPLQLSSMSIVTPANTTLGQMQQAQCLPYQRCDSLYMKPVMQH